MTITYSPTVPVVGDTVTLALSGMSIIPSDTDTHEWLITSVPPLSAIALGHIEDDAGDASSSFDPDAAGAYGITAYRFQQVSTPPSWDGDSRAASPRQLVATESTTINVAETLDLPISTFTGHGVTLRCVIQDTRIASASLVEPLTETSRQAIEDATVIAAVAALAAVAVTTLGPQIVASTNEVIAAYEAHRVRTAGPTHPVADAYSTVLRDPVADVNEAISTLNILRNRAIQHLIGSSTFGVRWHGVDDGTNMPLAALGTSRQMGVIMLCDLRQRFYQRHRVKTGGTHTNADTTNTLATAITPLETLVVALFDFIASAAPTVPTGEPAGSITAIQSYGFEKVA